MDRYKAVAAIGTSLSLGAGIIMSKVVTDISKGFVNNYGIMLMAVLITAALVFLGAKFVLEELFRQFLPLRRWVLGKFYIEGTWCERVRRDGVPHGISIVQLLPDGYSVVIAGTNYNPKGVSQSSFRGKLMEMNWPTATFHHNNNTTVGPPDTRPGIGTITFSDRHPFPNHFSAHYAHVTEGVSYSVNAFRLEDEADLAQISSAHDRQAWLLAQWKKFAASEAPT